MQGEAVPGPPASQQGGKRPVRAEEMPCGGKLQLPSFPPHLEIPPKARDSHISTAPTTGTLSVKEIMNCTKKTLTVALSEMT
jgi:hypothetical protein